MRIFYRRPLSLILCIMLGGFLLFSFLDTSYSDVFIAIPLLLLAATFIKCDFIQRNKTLIRVALFALSFSMLLSHCYFNIWYKAYERFDDERVSVVGTVYEITDYDYYSKIYIRTDSINGEALTKYNMVFYLEADEDYELEENDAVALSAELHSFSSEGENFNNEIYYLSRGFSAKLNEIEELERVGTASPSLRYRAKALRSRLTKRIISQTDDQSGGLLAALLLGDKEYLSPQVNLDFRRIGISHILALSGLHLSILAIGLSKLLSLFGLGKKERFFSTIVFTLAYMTLTGFPVSVLRAGFMLIVSYSLFLFARSHDSMTSLFISVAVICAIEPYSVLDLSLWLSACATFGIVSLGDLRPEYDKSRKKIKKLFGGIKNSFCVSLFAMSATFLITALNFDSISSLSPVSTFIFSPLIQLYLYLGIFTLLLGDLLPLGAFVKVFGSFIMKLAAIISDWNFACISTDYTLLKVLIIAFTVCFIAFLILSVRKRALAVGIISSIMCCILASGIAIAAFENNKTDLSYELTDDAESLYLCDSATNAIISEASPSSKSAYSDIALLREKRATRLHAYVITEYSSSLPAALNALLANTLVECIYLPEPKNDFEYEAAENAKNAISAFRACVFLYDESDTVKMGGFHYAQFYRDEYKSYGIRNGFTLDFGNETVSYLSAGILNGDAKTAALKIMSKSDVIILGRHGTEYYNYKFTYNVKGVKALIISSQNVYVSPYTLDQYKSADVYFSPESVALIR